MANEVRINLGSYLESKAKGVAKLVNVEGMLHYVERRFDPATGKATPAFVPLDIENLKQAREAMANDLKAMDQVIADAEAALKGPSV